MSGRSFTVFDLYRRTYILDVDMHVRPLGLGLFCGQVQIGILLWLWYWNLGPKCWFGRLATLRYCSSADALIVVYLDPLRVVVRTEVLHSQELFSSRASPLLVNLSIIRAQKLG